MDPAWSLVSSGAKAFPLLSIHLHPIPIKHKVVVMQLQREDWRGTGSCLIIARVKWTRGLRYIVQNLDPLNSYFSCYILSNFYCKILLPIANHNLRHLAHHMLCIWSPSTKMRAVEVVTQSRSYNLGIEILNTRILAPIVALGPRYCDELVRIDLGIGDIVT